MDTPSPSQERRLIRQHLKSIRAKISLSRRLEASQKLHEHLGKELASFPSVLAFCSFGTEIDIWPLLFLLAKRGQLLLPRVKGENLHVYAIKELEGSLLPHPLGMLEPSPQICLEEPLSNTSIILVPGLAFDKDGHRLGYGRGYYDRLLSAVSTPSLGVGFLEQMVEQPLPTHHWDKKLHGLRLY